MQDSFACFMLFVW